MTVPERLKGRFRAATTPIKVEAEHLSLEHWLSREIEAPDYLVGELLSTTSRAMLAAATGIGKTNFCVALGFAIAGGAALLHWQARRAARVLYVDGEMSRRLMTQRLADAARRAGARPVGFSILCRDDIESMPPLNTEEGQRFMDDVINALGGVDFIIFDNIMSLISGDMKDEESWSSTLSWAKTLTRRSIGQLWVHHTGIDETRSYGTKTKEWQLDTVIILEKVENSGADISFSLRCTKARERTPANRADFEPVTISLVNDAWTLAGADPAPVKRKKPLTSENRNAYERLADLIARTGTPAPKEDTNFPPGAMVVYRKDWDAVLTGAGLISENRNNARTEFRRIVNDLVDRTMIGSHDGMVWLCHGRAG